MDIASQASSMQQSSIDAEKAARHVELMQEGCLIQKKPAGQKATRGAPLQERQLSLSSDLKRLQLRDLAKHFKVVESFVTIEHCHELRAGGIGGDLRPKNQVLGFLLEKNATLNILFADQDTCRQWHESVRFLMAHKKNLLALGEAVERAHLIANVDPLHNPVLDSYQY